MRIAVVGSREYARLDAVRQFVWECERTSVIVSGGAAGVDRAAVAEARRLGMPYEEHLPDWNRYGKRAGAIRNREIVSRADLVVAFWDERSKGTAITIGMARDAGRPVRIFGRNGLPQADETPPMADEAPSASSVVAEEPSRKSTPSEIGPRSNVKG